MIYEGNDFMKLKKNWVKIVLFVLGVVILAVAAYICLPKILQLLGFLVKLFLPFLLGYLFSMAVNPLADTLQKRLKIPRGLSAVLVIVLIVGIFGGVLTFAIWKIVDEGRMLYTQFPTIYENIQNSTKALGEKCGNDKVLIAESLGTMAEPLGYTHGRSNDDLVDGGDAKTSGHE